MRQIKTGEICVPASEISQRALLLGIDVSAQVVGSMAKAIGLDYNERTDEKTINGRMVIAVQRTYSEVDVPVLIEALKLKSCGMKMSEVAESLVKSGKIDSLPKAPEKEQPAFVTKSQALNLVRQLADALAVHEPNSALIRKAKRALL